MSRDDAVKDRAIGEVLCCPEERGQDRGEVEDAEPGVGDLAVGCEAGDEGCEKAWGVLLGFACLLLCRELDGQRRSTARMIGTRLGGQIGRAHV